MITRVDQVTFEIGYVLISNKSNLFFTDLDHVQSAEHLSSGLTHIDYQHTLCIFFLWFVVPNQYQADTIWHLSEADGNGREFRYVERRLI